MATRGPETFDFVDFLGNHIFANLFKFSWNYSGGVIICFENKETKFVLKDFQK